MSESAGTGMDESRLRHLMDVMRDDIERDRYFGGVIAIGRHGRLALHEAIGIKSLTTYEVTNEVRIKALAKHGSGLYCSPFRAGQLVNSCLHQALNGSRNTRNLAISRVL